MRLTIIRDHAVRPGGERRRQDGEDIVWTVSAAGVTEDGARAFEGCTNRMIERHGWQDQVAGAYSYRQAPELLGTDVLVDMSIEDGVFVTLLHPEHFCQATISSCLVELRESLGDSVASSAR